MSGSVERLDPETEILAALQRNFPQSRHLKLSKPFQKLRDIQQNNPLIAACEFSHPRRNIEDYETILVTPVELDEA